MFRRAEIREKDALIRDARAINDKVRLLARLGAALIEAKESGADLQEAVASAIGWDKLARSVEEAERLARPDKADLPALGTRGWPVLHRLGPLFSGIAALAGPSGRCRNAAGGRVAALNLRKRRPKMAAQPADKLSPAGVARSRAERGRRRAPDLGATLLALRNRLRAGDIWVDGSRQWRALEDQLIVPALFAAMREAGPLPVAAPATAGEYLVERRALLDRRL
ncbi:MAG: Tn3 family transposase, partial [Bradyrhizobium sp.]